jgi:ATP-dependent Clp protease ATP-binding subunit ClpX
MNYDEGIQTEDLVKFGMLPEFLGRLPVVVTLDKLTEDDLVHILSGIKNSIVGQYTELLARDGIELVFEKEALREIAAMSIKKNTGARGLRSIIEKLMKNVMFEAPSDPTIMKVIVTKESVKTGKLECEKIAA